MSTLPKRRFVAGDEEPTDVRILVDAYGCRWTRTGWGWYPSQGSYDRRERPWWWLTMNRAPLEEQ